MEKNPYNIIRRPLITEKGEADTAERNAYHFEVAPGSNKIDIRGAIEKIYAHKGVKVAKVRVMNKKSKSRRFRFRKGKTRSWKKAIVFLDPEHKLELF